MLQQIADLAVIAIQNATKQEQLAKAEVMAALGDITGPLVHRTNNNVGAIRVLAQDICDEADEDIKSFAAEILSIAEQILEYSQSMRSWMRDKPQIINLEEIVQDTLTQTELVPVAHNLNVPTLTVAGSSPLSHQNNDYFPKQNFDGKEFMNQVQMLLK